MKAIETKTQKQIESEWDNIAQIRYEQINNKRDISYHHILVPCITSLSKSSNYSEVIDIGCGTGILTNILAAKAGRISQVQNSV